MIELPPRAAAKLAKLQQQSADMRALVDAARGSEAMLREKLGHAQHASRVAVADMSKQEAAAAIDGIIANLALAEQEVQTRQARMHLAQRVVGQISGWLQQIAARPAPIVLVDAPPIKLPDGITIELARSRIKSKTKELRQTKITVLSADDLRSALADVVDELAAAGAPTVYPVDGGVAWNRRDFVSTLAWFAPDVLLNRLVEEAGELPANTMSTAERSAKVREIEDEIERLSAIEESLIETALAGGKHVDRRPDCSPSAILGVKIASKVSAKAKVAA